VVREHFEVNSLRWIEEELPKTALEDVVPRTAMEQFKKWIMPSLKEDAGARWEGDQEIQPCIDREAFQSHIATQFLVMCACRGCRAEGAIQDHANTWTAKREDKFTRWMREFDEARTLRRAESVREYALKHQMFMYVDKGILRRKEAETRALCITPEVIQGVENRCWIHVADYGGRAKREVEEHLEHYGDIKQVMMDGLIIHVLEAIMDDEMSLVNQKKIWRRFLTFLEILGHGFSRYELTIYKAWWKAALKEHGGYTEQSDKPGRVLWNGIELVEENVVHAEHFREQGNKRDCRVAIRSRGPSRALSDGAGGTLRGPPA
jgi:hypothetical protein